MTLQTTSCKLLLSALECSAQNMLHLGTADSFDTHPKSPTRIILHGPKRVAEWQTGSDRARDHDSVTEHHQGLDERPLSTVKLYQLPSLS